MNDTIFRPPQIDIDVGSLTLAYEGHRIRISSTEVIVLKYVSQEGGSSYDEIMDGINSGRKDGGTSYKSLGVILHYLRKKLQPLDLTVIRINLRSGGAKGKYQLRTKEHAIALGEMTNMRSLNQLHPYAGKEQPEPIDVTVERGIPVPENIMPQRYHFDQLVEVGMSLLITNREAPIVRRALLDFKRKHPDRKFTVRKVPAGVRVWRLS